MSAGTSAPYAIVVATVVNGHVPGKASTTFRKRYTLLVGRFNEELEVVEPRPSRQFLESRPHPRHLSPIARRTCHEHFHHEVPHLRGSEGCHHA